MVARFVDDDCTIMQQRLISLRNVSKPINAQQLAQVINQCVATQLRYPPEMVVAAVRVRACEHCGSKIPVSLLPKHV